MTAVDERYDELWTSLHVLREAWLEFRLAVSDHPRDADNALVTRIEEDVDDGVAAVDEALASLASGVGAERADGRALAVAHEHVARARDCYWRGAGSGERRMALLSLARRHGGEWAAWVPQVDLAGSRVPDALAPAEDALRRTWLQLVESASSGTISVSATSIGQQIKVTRRRPDRRLEEDGKHG